MESTSQAFNQLIAGEVKTLGVDCKASLGDLAVGQVLEFNASDDKYVKYTSGSAKNSYVVVAEEVNIGASGGQAVCIVQGEVNLNELDATAKADAEITAALLGSGIIPRNQAS